MAALSSRSTSTATTTRFTSTRGSGSTVETLQRTLGCLRTALEAVSRVEGES